MSYATWRVVLRAVLVGVTTLGIQLQQSATWTGGILRGAIVAAVLAAVETLTPANALVGVKAEKK